MDLVKSAWVAEADRISLSMPIAKVDKANRLVYGWATADNIDKTDDVVKNDASISAFERFQGGIREMHQPIAAGVLREFKADTFYDKKTNKSYNGIFVTTYISEGAEDTWKKVLDGTLKAFSIGGNIKRATNEFNKDAGKSVRNIEEYDLVELSLVDNPGNQYSHITGVFKMDDDMNLMKGTLLTDTRMTNVFFCVTDEIASESTDDSINCFKCGNAMENIGWVEQGDDEVTKVAKTVADFLRQKEGAAENNTTNGEGGVTMSEEIKKDAEVSEPVTEDASTEVVEEVSPEEPEAAEETAVVEEAAVEPDLEKLLDNFKENLTTSIEKTVEAIEKRVSDATTAFDEKASEFEKSLGELGDKLESIRTERQEVTKRLDALEKSTAIKKSGDVETAPEATSTVQKGFWGSTIFGEDEGE